MKKYRPYFTIPELETISTHLRLGSNPPHNLIRYVDKFISDAKEGYRKESHTLNPRPTLEESLGFKLPSLDLESSPSSHEIPIEQLMAKYKIFGFLDMSSSQIKRVQQYRYENDMMSPEEEIVWETNNGANFK